MLYMYICSTFMSKSGFVEPLRCRMRDPVRCRGALQLPLEGTHSVKTGHEMHISYCSTMLTSALGTGLPQSLLHGQPSLG